MIYRVQMDGYMYIYILESLTLEPFSAKHLGTQQADPVQFRGGICPGTGTTV